MNMSSRKAVICQEEPSVIPRRQTIANSVLETRAAPAYGTF